MKKLKGVVLAILLFSSLSNADGHHTPDTLGISVLEIKDPFGYTIIVYCWVILIGILGGITGYIRKLKNNYARFSIAEILGECVISCLVALITFWLCEAAHIEKALQAAIIGICSHMGSKAIYQFESQIVSKFLAKFFGENNGKPE